MNVSTLPSQDLLRLCLQAHDESLWAEFVHRVQPAIAGAVSKRIRRRQRPTQELVDDLVQDTFVKLFANDSRALRDFDCQHENALFGFVKVVADRAVQDYFRKECSSKRGCGKAEEDIDGVAGSAAASVNLTPSIQRKIRMDETDKRLKEMLAGDPNSARYRAIFWLYYRYGFTAKEISQLPGINLTVKGVESVLVRLTRGLGDKRE